MNPSQKKEEYFDGPIKWLRAVDLNDGFVFETTRTLSEIGFESAGKSALLFKPGTLAISKSGTIGRVGILQDYMCGNRAVINIAVNEQICSTRFIFHVLKKNRHYFENMATGSVQKNLYTSVLGSLTFELPPLAEQKAIAHILGTLDDKIELNRQMNATLEAMAQALFKSWFVDFDPVIDNALAAGNPIPEPLQARAEARAALGDRRKPLPEVIQQQFPSSFVFNEELGWVPEGWELSTVGDEFDVTMGQSPPGHTYNEGGVGMPFFQGRADYGFRYPSNRVYCTEPKRLASKNDTLVSVRAPVGDVNMASEDCCIGRGVAAVRHKNKSRSYTYYSMLQLREHFNTYEAEGTVFGSINQKDFKALPQLCVPAMLVEMFHSQSDPIDQKIEVDERQITKLMGVRDTLLPKLLSGQLRIPDAEKLVADVL